jgi:hypothetical protein
MLSMGHVLIPQSDLRWSKQTDVGGLASLPPRLINLTVLLLSDSLPCGYDTRRGSTHTKLVSLSAALGGRVP